MKVIDYVARESETYKTKVMKLEKERKNIKTQEQKEEKKRLDMENQKRLEKESEARMMREVKKIGRPDMNRSEKPKVKQLEVKKIEDEETLDQKLYLGIDLKNLPEEPPKDNNQSSIMNKT